MTVRNFSNVTTIGSLVAPVAASAVSLSVQNFNQAPAVPYTVTLDRNLATEEICLVTAQAGGALTVVRGYDGSAGQSHAAGATIEHTAGAIEYTQANAHVNATVGVHGTTGDLVGDEGAQSIFDKTLIAPLVQADVVDGDAVVAYDPTGTRNLFRGMNQAGTDVIVINNTGKVNAASLAVTGTSTLSGALNANGGVTVPAGQSVTASGGVSTTTLAASGAVTVGGAATVGGTAAVTGVLTASGGITVPTGKVVTVTDAPAAGTSAANKTYVDGKTWPTTAITDAASAATASVIVKRDAAGRAQVATPSVAADIATKGYVDGKVVNLPGRIVAGTGTATPTAGQSALHATINFGVTFAAAPVVAITGTGSANENQWAFWASSTTTTTCDVILRWTSTGGAPVTGAVNFNWIAVGN